jgi:hypothetical protein
MLSATISDSGRSASAGVGSEVSPSEAVPSLDRTTLPTDAIWPFVGSTDDSWCSADRVPDANSHTSNVITARQVQVEKISTASRSRLYLP